MVVFHAGGKEFTGGGIVDETDHKLTFRTVVFEVFIGGFGEAVFQFVGEDIGVGSIHRDDLPLRESQRIPVKSQTFEFEIVADVKEETAVFGIAISTLSTT